MAGSKWVWVAPPECGDHMAAFGGSQESVAADDVAAVETTQADIVDAVAPSVGPDPATILPSSTADPSENTQAETPSSDSDRADQAASSDYMTNTSSFDVTRLDPMTSASAALPREYRDYVAPRARQAVLREGDVLVMPPGWWHAMVGLETSFSVSMWF